MKKSKKKPGHVFANPHPPLRAYVVKVKASVLTPCKVGTDEHGEEVPLFEPGVFTIDMKGEVCVAASSVKAAKQAALDRLMGPLGPQGEDDQGPILVMDNGDAVEFEAVSAKRVTE